MGYRSDIVIAVDQAVVARNLLTQEIPKSVLECFVRKDENIPNGSPVSYYHLSGWKWNTYYPEAKEIEDWFVSMEDEEFGAMRMGEEMGDVEIWGSPSEYNIFANQFIDF